MNHGYDLPERLVVEGLIADRLAQADAERLIRSARAAHVPRGDPALARVGRLLIGLGESLSGRTSSRSTEDPCAGAGAH